MPKRLVSAGLLLALAGCSSSPDNGSPARGDVAGASSVGGGAGMSSAGGAASGSGAGLGGTPPGGGPANIGGEGLGGSGAGGAGPGGGGAGPNAGGAQAGGGSAQGGGGQAGGAPATCGPSNGNTRLIAFGTTLDPQAQVCESRALAQSLADPNAAKWRAKGDQKRTYRFKAANADVAYRVVVPTTWDGTAKLPLVMFLHGAGNDESSYLDQNNKQMVNLAQQHGYLLVSPLGYQGAYGNFLRLPAVFGQPEEVAQKIAAITPESETTNELSEKDVINVLELVLNEYPIDRAAMFLTGHSMGSGGTWYIGAKYADYWAALAPMSGPFVQETGYLWPNIKRMPNLVTEGTQAASVAGSHALRDWMTKNGFKIQYQEVNADHPGMVPLVLPAVFTFFDSVRAP